MPGEAVEALLENRPDAPESYQKAAEAMLRAGRGLEAELAIAEGLARLGPEPVLARRFAELAAARQDWAAAARRFAAALRHAPNDAGARRGYADALFHLRRFPSDAQDVLQCFESLGHNCEFGQVQRQYGLERPGLLRHANITFDDLLQLLATDFAGIGEPEYTKLRVNDTGEYLIDDTRYGLGMQTFTGADRVAADRMAQDAQRNLTFLVRQLREDLRAPERIFIRANRSPEPVERILMLHSALPRYGQATLLAVEECADPSRIGRAEWLAPGVLRGWIERFTTYDTRFEQWLEVCRNARALRTAPAAGPIAAEEVGPLLLGFEPLGEDMSFGLAQRAAGLEPLGLLRFAVLGLDTLIAALDTDFAGIGAPENTQLLLRDQIEYVLRDARSGLLVHTFREPLETPLAVHAAGCRVLPFLARRLLEELRAPSKIFVRTSRHAEPIERILALARALVRQGPATLLFVEQSADTARIGRAEWLAAGVMRGAVGRLGPVDMNPADWIVLCRHARALFAAAPPAQATISA